MATVTKNIRAGSGVLRYDTYDIAPKCEIVHERAVYDLKEISRNKHVVDVGCGFGSTRPVVESVGGTWVGVEPFEGGAHTVIGDAQNLPFEDNTFDVVIMNAVLEHVPIVHKAFEEVARVLKPGGLFVGYAAFMESFHLISYSHLSFRAIELYAEINNMKLERIGGGQAFGIDYHINHVLSPLPVGFLRPIIRFGFRSLIKLKVWATYFNNLRKGGDKAKIKEERELMYKVECLRFSNGFTFKIRNLKQ